jgi:hypothetical protein
VTRNSLLPWFMLLVAVEFFASPRDAQAQTNPKLVLASFGAQLSAGEGNNIIVPIDLPSLNHSGLNQVTLVGTGPEGPSSASVAVKVINPENLSTPEHFQIVQTVGTTGSDITQSIVSFFATSSIKTSIGVQSVLSVTYSSGPTDINLINTGIDIQFSDGTKLFECTTIPPFPTPPCIVVTPGGFSVTWSKQSSSVTSVTGSLLLTLADLAYVATLTTDIEVIQDSVILNNTTLSQGNGVWVNGIANGAQWNHQTFSPQNSAMFPTPGSSDSVTIPMGGNVTHSNEDNGNEIVAFATDRPVALKENVGWTPGTDNIEVPFQGDEPLNIPIRIWIVEGNYAQRSVFAAQQVATATTVWSLERMGLAPAVDQIVDATANLAVAPLFYNFDCFNVVQRLALKIGIGFTPGMVNVYYVRTIRNDNKIAGITCPSVEDGGGKIIALPEGIAIGVLVHELGHALGLGHVGTTKEIDVDPITKKVTCVPGPIALPDFQPNNVMWQGCRNRVYLTEGQTFRGNLAQYSVANTIQPPLRPGQPTRNCESMAQSFASQFAPESLFCPAIDKRIWADGALPPN